MPEIPMVGARKILGHMDCVRDYLQGGTIYPVTLELGLTAQCNRKCLDCPSSLGMPHMSLKLELIDRILQRLKGQTKGLIVTGGEPTLSGTFAETLRRAKTWYDFEDIVVVSNGSRLEDPDVFESLLAYASAIRVSLYDWEERCQGVEPTLQRIESLRKRIEKSGSRLEIGVSALTSRGRDEEIWQLAAMARQAGAHWLYFHPNCVRDGDGIGQQAPHAAIAYLVDQCRRTFGSSFPIHWLPERYSAEELHFRSYHTAHFVLVIAADGVNYLATETKYRPDFALRDLAHNWSNDFLWDPARLDRIEAVCDSDYPHAGTRNRGVIYNALIDRFRTTGELWEPKPEGPYLLPNIL